MIDLPPERHLTQDELRIAATELSARRWLWRAHVRHEPEQRTYAPLIEREHVSAWLICWLPGHDTGFHDHDRSAAAITVVEGLLREERLVLDGPPVHSTHLPGGTFDVAAHDIHRVTHGGGGPAISIHVYSPALERSGAYTTGPDGVLRRHPLLAGEELRPLAA